MKGNHICSAISHDVPTECKTSVHDDDEFCALESGDRRDVMRGVGNKAIRCGD